MKNISYFFFWSYIGLVLVAGFWGAFINPVFDHKLLFNLDISALPDQTRINMLSQYRFLRALELGYGIFSVLFIKEIFSENKYNLLFTGIMGMGVLARIFSMIFDGKPTTLFFIFFFWELAGIISIIYYSRKQINAHA